MALETMLGLGMGANLLGGLFGAGGLSEAEHQALGMIHDSIAEYESIGVPTEEAMRLSLEKYRSEGKLTPQLEQVINQGRSELEGISTDPRLRDAEIDSLDALRNVYESGGESLADKATFERAMDDSAQAERGAREAILMDAAQRGSSTSGGTLAAQLLNQQESARRGHDIGLTRAGMAQDRALEALRSSGELAGNIQGREFGQKAQVASAQDIINAANTAASRGVQQRNVAAMNTAQGANLANQQDISNRNVDISNQQQMYNKSLPQQTFQNRMSLAGAKANARGQAANTTMEAGKSYADTLGKIGSGVQTSAFGLGKYLDDEERKKSAGGF